MSSNQTIRVGGVPEHFNLPWHLALESGAAAQCGMAVQWAEYSTGTGAMLADLVAKRLDLAILLTEGAALGLARKLPIRAVSLYTTSPLIWGVHVPAQSSHQELADLQAAKFGISRRGSGSHLMSLAMAIEQGWPPEELAFEIVDNLPGAIAAFSEGRADAFLWEHFTTQPAVDAGHFRRVADFISPWPAWVVCAEESFWQQHQAAIGSLFAIVVEHAGQLASSSNAAALIAERYGLQQTAVELWLSKTEWVDRETAAEPALALAHQMLLTAGAL